MTIAAVVNADYTSTVNSIRSRLANGTQLSDYEMRLALAVVKDALSRFTTNNSAVAAQVTALQAWDTAGEVTAAGAAVVGPGVAAANTALSAAAISVPTVVTSAVADG